MKTASDEFREARREITCPDALLQTPTVFEEPVNS